MESDDHGKVRPEKPSFAYRIRSLQADLQTQGSFLQFSVIINPWDSIGNVGFGAIQEEGILMVGEF